MDKKFFVLCILNLCLGLVFGANNVFNGNGDGVSWSDPDNWSMDAVPVSSNDSFIGYNNDNTIYNVTLDGSAYTNQIKLGIPETYGGEYILNVEEGGNLDGYRLYLGIRGVLNVNGGVFNVDVFADGGGSINIKKGSFVVNSSSLSLNNASVIDMRGGQLIMNGDARSHLQNHINNGRIVAFGGLYSSFEINYDSGSGTTTLEADVSGGYNIFTGNGDGISWEEPANWSAGTEPVYNTDSSMLTYIGTVDENAEYDVTIEGNAGSGRTWLGVPEATGGSYTLNIGSYANYYLVRMYVGRYGTLNINGGSFNAWEGRFHGGSININAGLLTIRSNWWALLDYSGSVPGVITLNGGTLRIINGTSFSKNDDDINAYNPEFTGVMNFRGGELVMDGDCRNALEWHINNGNIQAFGGDPDGVLEMAYDTQANTTTVKVVSDYARLVKPADNMVTGVDDRHSIKLLWEPGELAPALTGYNVYFGTDAENLSLVNNPQQPQSGTSWSASSLSPGQTYYWRIDEVVDGSSVEIEGNIWSFTVDQVLLSPTEEGVSGTSLDHEWFGLGDNSNWSDAYNWTPSKPDYEFGRNETSEIKGSVDITVNSSEGADKLWIGRTAGQNQNINIIDGGELYFARFYSGTNGSVTLNGGSLSTFYSYINGMNLIINSGTYTCRGADWYFSSGSTVALNGGKLNIENPPEDFTNSIGFADCSVEFNGGEIQFNGDKRDDLAPYLHNGVFIAASSDQEVGITYDAANDKTVVRAFGVSSVAIDIESLIVANKIRISNFVFDYELMLKVKNTGSGIASSLFELVSYPSNISILDYGIISTGALASQQETICNGSITMRIDRSQPSDTQKIRWSISTQQQAGAQNVEIFALNNFEVMGFGSEGLGEAEFDLIIDSWLSEGIADVNTDGIVNYKDISVIVGNGQ